jgi:hypothetical protein
MHVADEETEPKKPRLDPSAAAIIPSTPSVTTESESDRNNAFGQPDRVPTTNSSGDNVTNVQGQSIDSANGDPASGLGSEKTTDRPGPEALSNSSSQPAINVRGMLDTADADHSHADSEALQNAGSNLSNKHNTSGNTGIVINESNPEPTAATQGNPHTLPDHASSLEPHRPDSAGPTKKRTATAAGLVYSDSGQQNDSQSTLRDPKKQKTQQSDEATSHLPPSLEVPSTEDTIPFSQKRSAGMDYPGIGEPEAPEGPDDGSRFQADQYQPSPDARPEPQLAPWQNLVMTDVNMRQRAENLNYHIFVVSTALFRAIGQEYGYRANIPTQVSPALSQLYKQVLGLRDWQGTALALLSRDCLSAGKFLTALISAFIYMKIFEKDVPWDSPLKLQNHPTMDEFVAPLLKEKGVIFQKIMHQAGIRQVLNEDFQAKTIRPRAAVLAKDLVFVLGGHLEQLVRIPVLHETDYLTEFRDELVSVMEEALVLQGLQKAHPDTYTPRWVSDGTQYDRSSMEKAPGSKGETVAFTVHSGWFCQPISTAFAAKMPARAVVHTIEK